jgi:hypothetical protein
MGPTSEYLSNEKDKQVMLNKLLVLEDTLRSLSTNCYYAQPLYMQYAHDELNNHWLQIRFSFFRLIILDLPKIFSESKNQTANIFRFLSRMEDGGDFRKIALPKERIAYYKNSLVSHQGTIDDIINSRDNYIAHTGVLFGLAPNALFFSEVSDLMTLCHEFMNECMTFICGRPARSILIHPSLTDFLPPKLAQSK